MPPLARVRVAALAELAEQLAHASRDALIADLDRAEALVGEIDPDSAYEEDWLIERVTGMRPDLDHPATLVGGAVLADLSAFVEQLCDSAKLTLDEVDPGSIRADELAGRWGVSRKTVDRYRRRGLIGRRVVEAPGCTVLVFTPRAVERFEQLGAGLIERAGRYSRIDRATTASIIAAAVPLRDRGLTLNQASRQLADRFGRSHEAIRQLLTRHNKDAGIFIQRRPLDARAHAIAWRAANRGLEPTELARRWRRSPASVRRGINLHRAMLLGTLDLACADELDRPADQQRALSPEPVTSALAGPAATDLAELIEHARAGSAPIGAADRARLIAACALRTRARQERADLSRASPESGRLDRIETDLRWTARLIASVVRAHLGSMVRTLEGRLGVPLDSVRSTTIAPLVACALDAMAQATLRFDPTGTGKLPARLALEIDRAAQRWLTANPQHAPSARTGRASARLARGVVIPDWTRSVAPWQAWLEPDRRVAGVLDQLDEPDRVILVERFGWAGPPRTCDEFAAATGLSRIAIPRLQRRAVRAALALARR